ncbi:cochaperone p23, putative [Plasmodium gallinaceum]|uniref:Cochaperone p23, putative n=1 Tax=Plasmodium gallinaceum TaxID=5849 RepID=A0A1J1GR36_PLAGA|nr:cochaperone p23, putative [Plasmodium gallinaceum]CRG94732.1 cochaperone p23, putative [Plasmodium gallinaceum]
MPLYPIVLWAQKKECIYLTIELQEIENVKIDLKEDKLYFFATKDKNEYEFTLNFLKPINVDESKYSTKRNIKFKIIKKEKERWKTINNDGKKHWIKCDWNSWVDTDEENKTTEYDDMAMNSFGGMGGMPDMSQLGNMGGMGDLDFSKLGNMGGDDMANFSGLGGMDQFKNMPNMNNMNDDDSSSYGDDSSEEDDDDEEEDDDIDNKNTEEEKKNECNDSKCNIENENRNDSENKIQDPIVEVQEPVA